MATAVSPSVATSDSSDNEKRWVIVGVCLNKVLPPVLRSVLSTEITKWYQSWLQPPMEIDKQTGDHVKTLLHSKLKLNYQNINNNDSQETSYDFAIKDPLSLAKLLVPPFMADFTGFDNTLDASTALCIICGAEPFTTSYPGYEVDHPLYQVLLILQGK